MKDFLICRFIPSLLLQRSTSASSSRHKNGILGSRFKVQGSSVFCHFEQSEKSEYVHRGAIPCGCPIVVCDVLRVWALTRGCPNVACGIYLGRHTGLLLLVPFCANVHLFTFILHAIISILHAMTSILHTYTFKLYKFYIAMGEVYIKRCSST